MSLLTDYALLSNVGFGKTTGDFDINTIDLDLPASPYSRFDKFYSRAIVPALITRSNGEWEAAVLPLTSTGYNLTITEFAPYAGWFESSTGARLEYGSSETVEVTNPPFPYHKNVFHATGGNSDGIDSETWGELMAVGTTAVNIDFVDLGYDSIDGIYVSPNEGNPGFWQPYFTVPGEEPFDVPMVFVIVDLWLVVDWGSDTSGTIRQVELLDEQIGYSTNVIYTETRDADDTENFVIHLQNAPVKYGLRIVGYHDATTTLSPTAQLFVTFAPIRYVPPS